MLNRRIVLCCAGFVLLFSALAVFAADPFSPVPAPEPLKFPLDKNTVWSRTSAREVRPGILYVPLTLTKPRNLRVHLVRINLRQPGLRFAVTSPDPEFGAKMPDCPEFTIHTRRQTTDEFLKSARAVGRDMVVAINATPWVPFKFPWTHRYAQLRGLVVDNGTVLSGGAGAPTLIVYRDGRCELRKSRKVEDTASIAASASGFNFVLTEGRTGGSDKGFYPRTVIGLSRDAGFLYLLAADGKRPDFSAGMTERETGEWMLALGAYDAVNFDGGGSTALALFLDNRVQLMNAPSDGHPRAVANNIGIWFQPR